MEIAHISMTTTIATQRQTSDLLIYCVSLNS